MHDAMTRGRVRALTIAVGTAVLAGGVAVVSSAGSSDARNPAVSCAASAQARLELRGRVPAGVTTVYLGYSDGASVQARVARGAYAITAPGKSSAGGVPEWLDYRQVSGRLHRQRLAADRLPRCGARATRGAGHASAASAGRGNTKAGRRATDLINRASATVTKTVPGCGLRPVPKPSVTIGDGVPSSALLNTLGVLRRSPTPEELAAAPRLPAVLGVVTFFRRYTRIVHIPGAKAARIAIGVGQRSVTSLYLPRCQRQVDRVLARLLVGEPRAVRRDALAARRSFKLGPGWKDRHPWLDYEQSAGTGGPFDAASFGSHGIITETSNGQWAEASGLVPDGVASVVFELAGRRTPGGGSRRPRRFVARVLPGTNVFYVRLGKHLTIPFGKVRWRDAAGRTIRVIP